MSRFLSLLGLLSLLALGGCDGDEPPAGHLPALTPLPECPDADYSTCDIRDRPCQERIGRLAACLRGDEPIANLSIDVLSESAFATMLRADAPEPPTATEIRYLSALSLFDLWPAGVSTTEDGVQDTAKNIAGLYLEHDKRIIIVDHDRPSTAVHSNMTLLHEYIHALQDVDYDLSNWPQGVEVKSFDGHLARKSLIEGEARFYEYRASVPLLGLDIAEVDFDSAMQEHFDHVLEKAFESDAPMNASFLTFPYAYGARQVHAAWRAGGPRGTDPLWASAPASSQQVMSGVLGIDQPQSSSVEIPTPDMTGTNLTVEFGDVLGAWGLNLLLERKHVNDAVELALGWRGDRFWVARDARSTDASCVLWEIELESEASAKALNDAFASFGTLTGAVGVDHETAGKRVYLNSAYKAVPSSELAAAGKRWLSGN